VVYAFLPQHFLYFFSLPHAQGSLRPILAWLRFTVVCGGQQLVLLHPPLSDELECVVAGVSLFIVCSTLLFIEC
jgi:hypothetical protein